MSTSASPRARRGARPGTVVTWDVGFALPPARTDDEALQAAALANRAYARLLLSGTAVSTTQYAERLAERGVSSEAARARIKRDRARGRLVTVHHEGEALVPTFQLDVAFDHDPAAGDAVAALLDEGVGPWGVWDWFETPNSWADGRTPAQLLVDHDHELLATALAARIGPGPDA